MRHLLNFLAFLLLTNIVIGQVNSDTIYLDSKWEKASKDNFYFYRILTKDNSGLFDCKDFWKSGELQMTGKFSALYPQTREGEFKWYHKNGNLRQIISYKSNNLIGQVKSYDSNGKFDLEYMVLFDSLDNSGAFQLSLSNFRTHISRKLKYPKNARIAEIHGRVMTKFYINNLGQLERFSILQSVNNDLDNEAKRVITTFNKWPIPMYKGKSTFVEIYMPINFSLD